MPISRDPRMDRRRRVLRDTPTEEPTPSANQRGRQNRPEETPEPGARRGAGYSQNVRGACGHRLVQLIPVRRRSYLAAMAISLLIPSLLLLAHYMIYVSGTLAWYGHPLATCLDAFHPQSIAAWFCSHLWLLCLGTTLLTFQLRKHKLDDYNGEYRLWFWLVLTCLIGSIDSTTHLSELLGLSLDKWTQINLGWSGPTVVQATLAVMIGLLGLRLCTELKSVPTSLMFWLTGLLAWAASAALGQDLLKLDMSQQIRIWLRCVLWLGGLTAIWLASLSYLRSIYIEAQRRFLLRGRLATSVGVPLRTRLRESMPQLPTMPRLRRQATPEDEEASAQPGPGGWRLFGFPKQAKDIQSDEVSSTQVKTDGKRPAEPMQSDSSRSTTNNTPSTPRLDASVGQPSQDPSDANRNPASSGLGGFLRRKSTPAAETAARAVETHAALDEQPRSRLWGWLPGAKNGNQADEYKKLRAEERSLNREQAQRDREAQKTAKSAKQQKQPAADNPGKATGDKSRRNWIPKFSQLKLPKPKLAIAAWMPRLKIPSFGLSSLRLSPPKSDKSAAAAKTTSARAAPASAMPANANPTQDDGYEDENDESNGRPMTKAERKRLRRLQQQNRAA